MFWILNHILTLVILFIVGTITWIIGYPWLICKLYQIKHGKNIANLYYPIIGLGKHFNDGIRDHKDVTYYKRHQCYTNPDVEVIVTNLFGVPYFQAIEPMLAKEILMNPENYIKRPDEIFRDVTSVRGLVYAQGQRWKDQRHMLADAFSFSNLQLRIPAIKESIQQHFKFIEGERYNIIYECARVASSVIQLTFFNQQSTNLINGKELFQQLSDCAKQLIEITYCGIAHQIRTFLGFSNLSTMSPILMTSKEKQLLKQSKIIHAFVEGIVNDKLKSQEKSIFPDMIETILHKCNPNNGEVSADLKEDIIQQYMTFLFAGTDTTSHLAGMTLYTLAKHQNIYEQIKEELKVKQITFNTITGSELNSLRILNAFIQECLRLVIPTDGLIPRVAIRNHYIGKYYIRKGSYVDIGIQPLVTHPKYFENHLEIDLNRWLNGNVNYSAFIPFSGGPRNCIGQHLAQIEVKLMVLYIVENYQLLVDPETDLIMEYGFLLEPRDDRLVKFIPIK